MTKTSQGGNLPAWQSRQGHRNRFRSAPCGPCWRRSCPVPSLDVPVPQTVDRLEDVLKIVDNIAVPKISRPVQPSRAVIPATQMGEQLVEVPWVSPSSVLRVPEPQMENQPEEVPRRAHSTLSRGKHRQPRAVHKFWARLTTSL